MRPAVPVSLAAPKRTASGFPSPAEDWLEPRLRLDDLVERPASTYFMRMRGQAMAREGISEGDLLVVDRSLTPRSGSMVVAFCGGAMLVRRLHLRQGVAELHASDGTAAQRMDPEQGDFFWGVVRHGVYSFKP